MTDSRKTDRQAIAALLTTNLTDLVAVYDHETKDIGGLSPVAMVHSDGTSPPLAFGGYRRNRYKITLLWRREDGDATEDYIDDLSEALFNLLQSQTTLDLRIVDDFSALDYPDIEGVMYRREVVRVEG